MGITQRKIAAVTMCMSAFTLTACCYCPPRTNAATADSYIGRSLGEQPSPDVVGPTPNVAIDNSSRYSSSSEKSHSAAGNDPKNSPAPKPAAPVTPSPQKPSAPVTIPFAPPPEMDKQAVIDALSNIAEFQKNSLYVESTPSNVVAGISAAIDSAKFVNDLTTMRAVVQEITKFEMTMNVGETAHVNIYTTPSGKVGLVRIPSLDTPILSDGKNLSINTTINAPSFSRVQDAYKTDEQKKKELKEFYESLDAQALEALNREMKKNK